jgi:hypothetical protein
MKFTANKAITTLAFLVFSVAGAAEPCRIEVVEKDSGWPVPLVELRTTHHARFITDNAGIIAFDLPELMGRETWFDVIGNGYEVPPDGFGYRGVRLTPEPGKTLRVEVEPRPADRWRVVCREPADRSVSRRTRVRHSRLRQRTERRASRETLLGLG